MRDPEKASASAAVLAPAPSGRARFFAALLGLLLFCGGGWCLSAFVKSPSGQLPWLPGTWKGAPLILGACFGGVYGALLLILRRFSLRGMLLCSILSAALAAGLTAYVQTITETQTIRIVREVPSRLQDKYLDVVSREITSQRVLRFLESLHAEDKLARSRDFNSLTVTFSTSQVAYEIECKLNIDVMTYVDPSSSEIRTAAENYVNFLLDVYKIKPLKDFDRPKKETMVLDDLSEFVSTIHWIEGAEKWQTFLQIGKDGRALGSSADSEALLPESELPNAEQGMETISNESPSGPRNRRLRWLFDHETEPWIKQRLQELLPENQEEQMRIKVKMLTDFEAEFKGVRSQVSQPFAPILDEEGNIEDEKGK